MKTAGIICEYNPMHLGHLLHIEKTRQAMRIAADETTAVICVMSGNFVQRGDFAVLNKHARAKMAIQCGADLVIELPTPYVLQSAEGFAEAGVFLLSCLGVCDYISFGSEIGEIDTLREVADVMSTDAAHLLTKQWLKTGLSYAAAQQKSADTLLDTSAHVLGSPNNILAVEYIKALNKIGSSLKPITIKREGGEHDGDSGYSASAIRKEMLGGGMPKAVMPQAAVSICSDEISKGRGPNSYKNAELALLSRLRSIEDYSKVLGTSEGLESRFKQYASTEPSIASVLNKIKTKRYPMSRLRRMLMCAVLGIQKKHTRTPPPYARVLAMNDTGMKLLSIARKKTQIPIITKPASVYKLNQAAIGMFMSEASATDLYVLAYQNEAERRGGQEWRTSPFVVT